ncbi:copper chaperone PCu(A)C [Aureimonas sp. AU40]|uniref:copper chaperone PCu(A)C n=1 Tax=Aureimonas sp. AU40 TaxID=1637747 RepID=UPI000784AFEE|nr:copper chaperone PCu(A)C [Aureimonas sp. AU40]
MPLSLARLHALALAATLVLGSLGALSPAAAHGFKLGAIEIEHPWSRATPPGARTGAGYFGLVNSGPGEDKLISAASPAAEKVEIHEMSITDGIMNMRRVDGLAIPAGGKAALAPGGYHLMLMGLKAPFKEGQMIPVTLTFEKAGSIEVQLQVDKMGATGPAHVAHEEGEEGHQH